MKNYIFASLFFLSLQVFSQAPIHIYGGYMGSTNQTHQRHEFTAVMKDGSIKKFKSRIKIQKKTNTYCLKGRLNGKKTLISCKETQCIYWVNKYNNDTVRGYVYDNKWLFKMIDGRIKCFSEYAIHDFDFITHIQKDDGPVSEYTKKFVRKDLRLLISDDNKSVLLNDKRRKRNLTRLVMVPTIATSLFVSAFIVPLESAAVPFLLFGGLLSPIPMLLVLKKIEPESVILLYNANKRNSVVK